MNDPTRESSARKPSGGAHTEAIMSRLRAGREALQRKGVSTVVVRYSPEGRSFRTDGRKPAPEILATLEGVAATFNVIHTTRYPVPLPDAVISDTLHWFLEAHTLEHKHEVEFRDSLALPATVLTALQADGIAVVDGEYFPAFVGFACWGTTDNLIDSTPTQITDQLANALAAHLRDRSPEWSQEGCAFSLKIDGLLLEHRHTTTHTGF